MKPESTPSYYDVMSGSLILGRAALEDCLASGGYPQDIVALNTALTGEGILSDTVQTSKLEVDSWNREHYISFGQWITNIVSPGTLKSRHLHRAYELGLAPEPQRIYRMDRRTQKRFKNFGDFYAHVGATESIQRGKYDHLTFSDILSYVQSAAESAVAKGIRPTRDYFNSLDGPSYTVLERHSGQRLGTLLDLAGFPVVNSWQEEDFVTWGLKFMRANDGRLPSEPDLRYLSAKMRGPSISSVGRKVGGLRLFRKRLRDEYAFDQEYRQKQMEALKDDFEFYKREHLLPTALYMSNANEDQQLVGFARLLIAKKLLPGLADYQLGRLVGVKTTASYEAMLCKQSTTIKPADIEEAAEMLGVFDLLWPMEEYYLALRLPKQMHR